MQSVAPILLFVYNRPWHTRKTLEALEKNDLADRSKLYIYADGPKADISDEQFANIEEVRKIIAAKKWCSEVEIVVREKNWGLAENVIEGVTNIVNKHGRIIVLEDDLVTSPYFLQYCNEGLELYENVHNVYSINAYQFPLEIKEVDTFLSPLATSSWGWATWADKWKVFEKKPENISLIQQNSALQKRFNFADYDYATMLSNPKSWAVRWYYSVFVRNGVGLFPTKSLVENLGFDGSGENCREAKSSMAHSDKIMLAKVEKIDLNYYHEMLRYFTNSKNKHDNTLDKIKNIFQSFI